MHVRKGLHSKGKDVIGRRVLTKENHSDAPHRYPCLPAGRQRPSPETQAHRIPKRVSTALHTCSRQNHKSPRRPRKFPHALVWTLNSTPAKWGRPEMHRKARHRRFLALHILVRHVLRRTTTTTSPPFPTKKKQEHQHEPLPRSCS